MDENKREQFTLPLIRFAPFMAAGMLLAYFGGREAAAVLVTAVLAAALFCAVKRKGWFPCAFGMLWGLTVMTVWVSTYAEPIIRMAGQTFFLELEVTEVTSTSQNTEQLIARTSINNKTVYLSLSSDEWLSEGQSVMALVNLSLPNGDNMAYNMSNGVLLVGEIKNANIISDNGRKISRAIKELRGKFTSAVMSNSSGKSGELIQAMLLGEDEGLSPSLAENMRVCGAAHFMAVSGAHFAVLAAAVLGMIPAERRRTKTILSLLFAAGGILFFGPTKSVLRASSMFLLSGTAGLFRRRTDTLNSLCFSVVLITAFSPANILDIGFAMSVMGVFGAGVVGPKLAEKLTASFPSKLNKVSLLVRAVIISVCAVICTSPINAAVFSGVSASGAFVSLILAPLMMISMASLVILGATGFTVFAVPMELPMKIAVMLVEFLGKFRSLFINLDFKGAWIFPLICMFAVTAAAYTESKTSGFALKIMAMSVCASMVMTFLMVDKRSEIRFVGNSSTSAAVILQEQEAAVYISGGGGGLAESISRCMREHGASRISVIAAFGADYNGALTIGELSKMTEIGTVFSNEIVAEMLEDISVVKVSRNSEFSVNGVSITSAAVTDSETSADIVLYRGTTKNQLENSAKAAVYFFSTECELPKNGYNAYSDRSLTIKLPGEKREIWIGKG